MAARIILAVAGRCQNFRAGNRRGRVLGVVVLAVYFNNMVHKEKDTTRGRSIRTGRDVGWAFLPVSVGAIDTADV